MNSLVKEMKNELNNRIIPYWSKLQDIENGGFYGFVDYQLEVNKAADKGGILNSRILWLFSAAYCVDKDENNLKRAKVAFDFLIKRMIDKEFGGLYWMVDYMGRPTDSRKHTYNQAFGVYALAEYYRASGDKKALETAIELFELIEEKCVDEYGYLEEFDREWNEKENEMLSENDVISEKTMNTHLHILEAYTVLYEVWKDERLKKQLEFLLNIFNEKIYDTSGGFLKVFFDKKWGITLDIRSYGHDIEGSWLLDRAAVALGDDFIIEKTRVHTLRIAESMYNEAYSSMGITNEKVKGIIETSRIWWVQAESVVGFINAYEKTGDIKFKNSALELWEYIKEFIIDKRENSEWYWKVDQAGRPSEKPIVEPWKCPYHNGRMCIEIIERMREYV